MNNTNKSNDSIVNRIEFIKFLLSKINIEPMIDFNIRENMDGYIEFLKNAPSEDYDIKDILNKKTYDMTDVINNINGSLQYDRSDISTDHDFKGEIRDSDGNVLYQYNIKMVPYVNKNHYSHMNDIRRPEN